MKPKRSALSPLIILYITSCILLNFESNSSVATLWFFRYLTRATEVSVQRQKYVWKKKGQPLLDREVDPTVKHGGGNIMVWGGIEWESWLKLREG